MQKLVKKRYEILLSVILITSILWIKEIFYLFYDITDSPDFSNYKIYLDHFFTNQTTNKEQGLMYYYLVATNLNINFSNLTIDSLVLNKVVQQTNFYIFSFGLIGYYNLFKIFKFSKVQILTTLIFLNFFPPVISMKLVLKPEILAFSLLPWVIYFLERYKNSSNYLYLLINVPFLVSIISLKGNITVIVIVFVALAYLKPVLTNLDKKKILIFITFFIIFIFLNTENRLANGNNLFNLQSGSSENSAYDYKAPISTAIKVNFFKLLTSPIKYNHSDSFIAITLLDTNGDYFDLFWNNNASALSKSKIQFIEFQQSNEILAPYYLFNEKKLIIYQQKLTDVYIYEALGLLLSIFMYFFLLKQIFIDSKYRIFYCSAIIGMLVILIHSITGFPVNNFNPSTGDTFKPLYYGFVLAIGFSFLVINSINNNKKVIIYVLLYCIIVIFILGFPKIYNYEILKEIIPKIEYSTYCGFERYYFSEYLSDLIINCQGNLLDSKNNNLVFNEKLVNKTLILLQMVIAFYFSFENRLKFLASRYMFFKNQTN